MSLDGKYSVFSSDGLFLSLSLETSSGGAALVLSELLSVLPQGSFFLAHTVPHPFHLRGLGIIGQYLV